MPHSGSEWYRCHFDLHLLTRLRTAYRAADSPIRYPGTAEAAPIETQSSFTTPNGRRKSKNCETDAMTAGDAKFTVNIGVFVPLLVYADGVRRDEVLRQAVTFQRAGRNFRVTAPVTSM